MLTIFASPSRYTQGADATRSLGAEMAGLGLAGPALVVAGRSATARLADTWKQSLGEAGIPHEVHAFGGECSVAEVARIRRAAEAPR